MLIEQFFTVFLVIQLVHSVEELCTNFHERFPPMRMSFRFFLTFELLFNLLWICVLLFLDFPYRMPLMAFFNVLMFANGLWHLVWFWFIEKSRRYIPGLVTAPLHVLTFLAFYTMLVWNV